MVEKSSALLIPPLPNAQLGMGIDKLTGKLKASPFQNTIKLFPLGEVKHETPCFEEIASSEDFSSKIEVLAGIDVSGFGCSGSASYTFHQAKIEKNSSYQLIEARTITFPPQLVDPDSLKLDAKPADFLERHGVKEFCNHFGEYFIGGVVKGLSGRLVISVIDGESSSLTSHDGEAQAQIKGFLKAKVAGHFETNMKNTNKNFKYSSSFHGIDKSRQITTTVDGLIATVRTLDKETKCNGDAIYYVPLEYTYCAAVRDKNLEENYSISVSAIQASLNKEYLRLKYLLIQCGENDEIESETLNALDAIEINESKITSHNIRDYKKASSIELQLNKIIKAKKGKAVSIRSTSSYGQTHGDTRTFDTQGLLTSVWPKHNPMSIHLKGIKYHYGSSWSGVLNGVQFKFYNEDTNEVYTTPDYFGRNDILGSKWFELSDGEYLTAAAVNCGGVVDGICISTSSGRTAQMGSGTGGSRHTVLSKSDGIRIIGFFGGYGGHLHNIGFHYISE